MSHEELKKPAVGLRREAKVLVAGAVLAQLLDHLRVAVGLGALIGTKVDRVLHSELREGHDCRGGTGGHFGLSPSKSKFRV